MDYAYLKTSFVLSNPFLGQLMCAYDEGCLSTSADYYMHFPERYTRRLLRFSARFWNRGTDDFVPDVNKNDWQWHSCHQHFHSMERFADFDLLGEWLSETFKTIEIRLKIFKFIKAFSNTVFDMKNAAYYDKPLIFIKAVSDTVFDMTNSFTMTSP